MKALRVLLGLGICFWGVSYASLVLPISEITQAEADLCVTAYEREVEILKSLHVDFNTDTVTPSVYRSFAGTGASAVNLDSPDSISLIRTVLPFRNASGDPAKSVGWSTDSRLGLPADYLKRGGSVPAGVTVSFRYVSIDETLKLFYVVRRQVGFGHIELFVDGSAMAALRKSMATE